MSRKKKASRRRKTAQPKTSGEEENICRKCQGKGMIPGKGPCPTCSGTGKRWVIQS